MAASLGLDMPAALFNPLQFPRKFLLFTPMLPNLCDSKFSPLNVRLKLPGKGRIFSAIRAQSSPGNMMMILSTEFLKRYVGVLGGGQLGRMLCYAACQMGIKVIILDLLEDCPASSLSHDNVVGNFDDSPTVQEFAKRCGVLTVEIEHVDAETLEILEQQGVDCQPKPSTIRLIQGEPGFHLASKLMKKALTIPGASVHWYNKPEMRKQRKMGHVTIISRSMNIVEDSLFSLLGEEIAEKLAVRPRVGIIMGSNSDYPVIKTAAEILRQFNVSYEMKIVSAHRGHDWMFSYASSARERGLEIIIAGAGGAAHLPSMVAALTPLPVIGVPVQASALEGPGSLLSILQMPSGVPVATVAINNSTNSGLLAVRMLGISDFDLCARMSQYLEDTRNDVLAKIDKLEKDEEIAKKLAVRPRVGIIMGSDSDYPAMKTAAEILRQFNVPYEMKIVSAHRTPHWMFSYASSARERGLEIIIAGAGGAAHLPGMVAALTSLPVIGVPVRGSALDGLDSLLSIVQMPSGVPVATVAINNSIEAGLLAVKTLGISDFDLRERMSQYLKDTRNDVLAMVDKLEKDEEIPEKLAVRPCVGIIIGSDSDYPIMKSAAEMLRQFNVPYEMKIVSTHRTLDEMFSYASSARERGLEIIIAGAGGAAHLPGMVAALAPLPIIAVPVQGSALDGLDSLLSTVQMPSGVPVATVAINNSTNAGLLAVRMLGISDFDLCARMNKFLEGNRNDVLAKVDKLEKDEEIAEKLAVRPRVGIIMGSDSDYPAMKTAAEILRQFNVPYEMKIVSAHRTPNWMFSYASSARERGLEIIIAGAGGAAHLPGMVAALTPLPVIGVPVRGSALDGLDSLLSILQMPSGVPVATVAINNSIEAGLLAVRMLGIFDFDLCARKMILSEQQSPDEKIEKDNFADYLENCTWNE